MVMEPGLQRDRFRKLLFHGLIRHWHEVLKIFSRKIARTGIIKLHPMELRRLCLILHELPCSVCLSYD